MLIKEDCGVTKGRQVGGDRKVVYLFNAMNFAKHAVQQNWLDSEELVLIAERTKRTVATVDNLGAL